MAKAKRRSKRMTKRRRKADWVYRPNIDTEEAVSLGGWGLQEVSLSTGHQNAGAVILYDSYNVFRDSTAQDAAAGVTAQLPRAARYDQQRRATVVMVDGAIFVRPSAWAVGSRLLWGVRLGWFEQDQATGLLSLDPDYEFWYHTAALDPNLVGIAPAIFANEVNSHIHDWHLWKTFNNEQPDSSMFKIFWKGRRVAPSENHCLALYLEGAIGDASVYSNLIIRPKVRAMIED